MNIKGWGRAMTGGVLGALAFAGTAFASTGILTSQTGSSSATNPGQITVPGVNPASAPNIFSIFGTIIGDFVVLVGVGATAFVVYSLIRAGVLFGLGGAQAQRREDAKSHLLHAGIGAVVVGLSGVAVGALIHFGQTL